MLLIFLTLILSFMTYSMLFIWVSMIYGNTMDKIFLLLLISISISTDIGGFIFGKIFKGPKLTKISPNKTYSGMFGSYILSIFLVLFIFKNYFEFDFLIAITLIVSTISQLGDLFISFLKRKSNLKDTGTLLPGHGGLLDRFDGLIFTLTLGSFFKLII
tara:strand:+ start:130 stop:606 length:477 start_codon:yes stop_codon:yes gene_type:complete